MVKHKLKTIISKRQMYRRNAVEIRKVTNDLNNSVKEFPEYSEYVTHQEHPDAESLSDIISISDSTNNFEIESVINYSEDSENKTNIFNQIQNCSSGPLSRKYLIGQLQIYYIFCHLTIQSFFWTVELCYVLQKNMIL